MDVSRFIAERRPAWRMLEKRLDAVDSKGLKRLDLEEARSLGRLYRETSADLLRARSHAASADVVDYLNDLVARAHGRLHPPKRPRLGDVGRFYASGFPRLVRKEGRAIALAAAFFVAGSLFGAGAMAVDPDAWVYVVPAQHQHLDPDKRVKEDREHGPIPAGGEAAFSAFLFTHNIKVTVMCFALGIFAGVLTAMFLFLNGVMLGSLAWLYAVKGHTLFFWAWILPHGVLEISAVCIGGGAGLLLGRAVLAPGRRRRADALREAGIKAVKLVLGLAPILVCAGIVEGTLSQWHAPLVNPWLKIGFAVVVGSLLWLWLMRAGRTVEISDG